MKYLAALSLLASAATATTTYAMAAEAAPSPAAGGMTHTVVVGGLKPAATGGMAPVLAYAPEAIQAAVGDKVKFVFMQKNHTATQSTFADPCKAMDGGQDSGFKPNPMGMAGPDFEWEMSVDTMEPIWMYCKQRNGTHCGKGMVFSVNAAQTGDKTHEIWKQLAIQKNGTEAGVLTSAAIQSVAATGAAAASTVTVVAGDGSVAATGAPGAAATVAAGQGVDGQGNACNCHCLCGINDFPQAAAVNNFGGFAGMFPS
ncbi:hypothetical protein EJ04DRAFT_168826 [Polyplosphaeria fusca]|uniref:Uncharacterized protein n=1 Tax=Polyplosphaeria fusca TaxID=682080 RepID=A0A9P4R8A8_9PLEO|nr:hypothetical protein EJ04DRAFT_168826 [Polyplosphaeria fusca]